MKARKPTPRSKLGGLGEDRTDARTRSWLGPLLHPVLGGYFQEKYKSHPVTKWFGSTLGLISFIGAPFTLYAVYQLVVWYHAPVSKAGFEESKSNPQTVDHGPTVADNLNIGRSVRARMFWGTLPPDGRPALIYALTNSGSNSLQNVSASVWIMERETPTKLDERHIGYVGQGEFREIQTTLSSTPYGRGLLCVSLTSGGKNVDVLHFFQSVGEYAKYGPMREMRAFRDPIIKDSGLCQSVRTNADTLVNH